MEPASVLQTLPHRWQRAPVRWGHSLHSLCSYMAMFPPSIPRVFVSWLTKPGDAVFDPFSGRGTAPFEASLLGRVGMGSDLSPLAWILTGAKVDPPSEEAVASRMADLEAGIRVADTEHVDHSIRVLFSPKTLGQLVWLQGELNPRSRADRFIMAALLGMLHRNADSVGRPLGLSVPMPNTFAMSPNYVSRYVRANNLKSPRVDVLPVVRRRIGALSIPREGFLRGHAWRRDALSPPHLVRHGTQPKLVFTSPPYLGVMKYGKLNWIRLWFLGFTGREVDKDLFATSSLDNYLAFMHAFVAEMASVLRPDGYVCLVVGDVWQRGNEINLASQIARRCLGETGLRFAGIASDRLPEGRKVSRIWGETRGRATQRDRYLILAGPEAHRLPPIPRQEWRG
jgi:hypothetical protein